MQIDKSKPVLVTGATGYLAGWLVKKLLEEGITVHAAVRNPDTIEKRVHLDAIAEKAPGKLIYFKTDLVQNGSYKAAMDGCEIVFHTASPFVFEFKDPQKELIDPALKGTANILEEVNQSNSVKRVVLTSSCAAIYNDAIDCKKGPKGAITEDMWNNVASIDYQPYSYSKTLAERKAWELNKRQNKWDLVTINPSFVMGPALNMSNMTSGSFTVLKQFGDGTAKVGVPNIGIGVVDVRDVAEAHFRAGYTPTAQGRYITSAHNSNFLEMATSLQSKFGKNYPIPKSALPKWLLMLIGPIADKSLSRRFIKNNVNIPWKGDNSKIKNELGIKFRPLKETMEDAFQVLVDSHIV